MFQDLPPVKFRDAPDATSIANVISLRELK